jgi:hypothetical protein
VRLGFVVIGFVVIGSVVIGSVRLGSVVRVLDMGEPMACAGGLEHRAVAP